MIHARVLYSFKTAQRPNRLITLSDMICHECLQFYSFAQFHSPYSRSLYIINVILGNSRVRYLKKLSFRDKIKAGVGLDEIWCRPGGKLLNMLDLVHDIEVLHQSFGHRQNINHNVTGGWMDG